MRFLFFSTAIFAGLSVSVHAEVIGLALWTADGGAAPFVFPVLSGKTHEESALEYLEKFSGDRNYRDMLKLDRLRLRTSDFTDLSSTHAGARKAFAIVANRPGQMLSNDRFIGSVLRAYQSAGAPTVMIPLGLETFLTDNELAKFQDLVSEKFPALVLVGGGDLDPMHYGQANTHSYETNSQRDAVELSLIRRYYDKAKGVIYGICRGHQAACVALGGSIVQHLPERFPSSPVSHFPSPFAITDADTTSAIHDIYIDNEPNALSDATGKKRFAVKSRHHQAVDKIAHGKAIATDGAGVIEAIEVKDGDGLIRVLTVQFHPEDMHADEGRAIFRWQVAHAYALPGNKTCIERVADELGRVGR